WGVSPGGGRAAPRPRGLTTRGDPSQPAPPVPRARPAAALADKPEQKSAAARAPTNNNVVTIGVVTIGPSAAAGAADPVLAGSAPKTPSFPPAPLTSSPSPARDRAAAPAPPVPRPPPTPS